jgi:3-hydroxyisobutyrate dehydrogenase-like beta-hydroxyacid dehydrogenase
MDCRRITLLGFGEVGQILAADLLVKDDLTVTAWDVQFANPQSIPARALQATRVRRAASAADAADGADLIVCAVTAANDVAAATSVAPHMAPGTWFLDLNSTSPGVRQQAASVITAGGGHYVEAAVMSPIAPARIATSILLGGEHAAPFQVIAHGLGFTGARVFAREIGRASAAKMSRSVIVKGMEALLTESMLTARQYGVEQTVLDSLRDLFPGKDWEATARYMISRSLQHGRRRAEEMREVATTVAAAGIEPTMSMACAARQDWAAAHVDAAQCATLAEMLDAITLSAQQQKI